jgi:hypothetical protein
MAFKKGNQLGANSKRVQSLLERLATQDDSRKLRAGLEKVMELFAEGDKWAIEYVTDRLDGKAAQTTNVNVTRHLKELTDAELLAIASSEGATSETESQEQPAQLH